MTKINRRGVLGGIGMGVAVAACSQTSSGNSSSAEASGVQRISLGDLDERGQLKNHHQMRGVWPSFEMPETHDSANANRRIPAGYTGSPPHIYAHVNLLYIKLGNGGMAARHAHFGKPAVADLGQFLEDQFTAIANGNWTGTPVGRPSQNFRDWNFGSPSKIYIYIENVDQVDKAYRFARTDPIRFTPLDVSGASSRSINNAFLNEAIDDTLWRDHELLVVENWYVDEQAREIPRHGAPGPVDPKLYRLYSMNLHLEAKAEGGAWIPLVLDPDTGNMGSDP